MYTITNLKQELTGILHGTTLDQIDDINSVIYRAARQILLDVDAQETIRVARLPIVYNDVFDYALPVDVKGNKIIDIYPQVNRSYRDFYPQQFNRDFDVAKSVQQYNAFSVMFNTGIKTVRISSVSAPSSILINSAGQITANGTWALSNSASNLREDNVNYARTPSSLMFDLSLGGSIGTISNQSMTPLDLSAYVNQGIFPFYVYLPDASKFTSIEFRLGSDTANYYKQTLSSDFFGNSLANGWNLLALDWSNASIVGTPIATAIDTIVVNFNYDGTAQAGVRLNNIFYTLGTTLNIEYYSKYLFKDSLTGAWQETITDDSNIVNLDTDSYNLLVDQVSIQLAQQQQGISSLKFDYQYWDKKYTGDLARYRALYKSQTQKVQASYYKKPNNSYNQWAGQRMVR